MSDVTQFHSQADRAAQAKLDAFVEEARAKPSPFGSSSSFDDNVWDVTEATSRSGLGRQRITFCTLDSARAKIPEMLPLAFRNFAKAYVIHHQYMEPTQNQQQRLSALRALEQVLRRYDCELIRLRADHLEHAATLIAQRFSGGGAYRIGGQLEGITSLLSKRCLIARPLEWENPIPRPRGTVRVGLEHDARRAKRLPSSTALEAVTLAFRQATHPSDQLIAATAALLCSAPVRIGEVLRMRAACGVEEAFDDKSRFGLRWWTSKGSEPEKRWVPSEMVPTVRTALATIRGVTEEARQIAAWYERHPTKVYLPSRYLHLRNAQFIDLETASSLLGLGAEDWAVRHGLQGRRVGRRHGFDFQEFEAAVLSDLPDGFPILEKATRLRASDALFVVKFNEFRTDRGSSACMFEPVTQAQVRDALGGRAKHGVASMFSRLGLTNDDGSPIKVNSHAFRHMVNTLAQRGGLDPLDIAKWSGRKVTSQNAAYDHVSADELLGDLAEAVGEVAPVHIQPPATADDFAAMSSGASHVTEFGFCVHDFAMLPCELHRDCLNCDEHVCVKGDLVKEARLVAHLEHKRSLLAKAQEGVTVGYEGADRWRDHQVRTVERAEQIVAILQDPDVPNGSVIRGARVLPDELSSGDYPEVPMGPGQ